MRLSRYLTVFLSISISLAIYACESSTSEKDQTISSRSYSGHENDNDANNFVKKYQSKVGTRLDDCQLCHSGGTLTKNSGGTTSVDNACSWCHYIPFPDTTTYTEGSHPQNYYQTLNSYGKAYMDNGRNADALETIASLDSDGDGSSNEDEIADNRFPGSDKSKPGQPIAEVRELTMTQVKALSKHSQFMLMNTTKQQYDDYVNYSGVTIESLLVAAGVDLSDTNITGITVFAPDGFKKQFYTADFTLVFPEATFYQESGLNYGNTNTLLDCTTYPLNIHGLSHGTVISTAVNPGGLRLMLAYQREGVDLSSSYYDSVTGRLEGEGPFRLVIPQKQTGTTVPGKPDRGSNSSQKDTNDGYNYVSGYNHNAGDCNRGAVVIRIDPMPAGYEEFDTTNGWSLITDKKIVFYGYGVTAE